jgi:cytohesin
MKKIFLTILVLPISVHAEIYKCVTDGKVIYQSQKCKYITSQKEIQSEKLNHQILENAKDKLQDAPPKQSAESRQTSSQFDPVTRTASDLVIAPGERIGPLRLNGSINDIENLFGTGATASEGGTGKSDLFSLKTWDEIGLWVRFDSMTGNEDIFAAVKSGKALEVKRLLNAGADVGGRDDSGATPLFWAAVSGSTEIAELLIAGGADVNARDRGGYIPLHVAAYQSRREVAEVLVRAGSDVNAKSAAGAGWTPLHKALERLVDPEMTQQVSPSDLGAAVAIVELLLANGADANARASSGTLPLNFAAASGQKALVELLLAKGADISAKGPDDVTSLYMAAKNMAAETDRVAIAKLLIARGAEVNAKTRSGYTALMLAAFQGDKEFVELLLTHGADVNAKYIDGDTPLLFAIRAAFFVSPSFQAYLSRQRSLSPVEQWKLQDGMRKMKGQWRGAAMSLIDHGADVNVVNIVKAETPLGLAANLGDKELVEALIAKGADVNGGSAALKLETPLHAAIAEMHRDVAKVLIINGANVNAKNMSQNTPLHFLAAYINDGKLAELMIEHGADINARNKNGQTPLHFATEHKHYQVANVLKRKFR